MYKIAYLIIFILWNIYLYIWKQWTISHCISAHYCLSLMQKSGRYPVWFYWVSCFSRELVTLGDQSSFAVLCFHCLHKMRLSMFNNLNTLQLGRFKANDSIVETHIIFHYFLIIVAVYHLIRNYPNGYFEFHISHVLIICFSLCCLLNRFLIGWVYYVFCNSYIPICSFSSDRNCTWQNMYFCGRKEESVLFHIIKP